MNIPFFNYSHVYKQYEDDFLRIFKEIAGKGSFIHQQANIDFEKSLARFLKSEYALGVGNCTDGLLLALKAAGIGRGDEVIFCSHTFVATASAIHHSGAIPVPVECGPDHLIDPSAVESAITSRTKAIMPTQLNGLVCDMDVLKNIVERNNLILIEDAAQSLGAKFKDNSVGTFGSASAFSFYPAKVVGCFGDGGAVTTNNKEIYNKVFLSRDHGRAKIGEVVTWGMNSRLDNLQAAILDFKLKKYPLDIEKRRHIAKIYSEGLNDVKEIILPRSPNEDENRYEIYQNYEIEVRGDEREKLRVEMRNSGIGTILQWGGKAVHQYEGLELDFQLPFTENLMSRCFLLPLHTALKDNEVLYIIDVIRNFYGY